MRGIPILVMSSANVPRIAARSLYVCSTKCTCGTQMYPSCNALVYSYYPAQIGICYTRQKAYFWRGISGCRLTASTHCRTHPRGVPTPPPPQP